MNYAREDKNRRRPADWQKIFHPIAADRCDVLGANTGSFSEIERSVTLRNIQQKSGASVRFLSECFSKDSDGMCFAVSGGRSQVEHAQRMIEDSVAEGNWCAEMEQLGVVMRKYFDSFNQPIVYELYSECHAACGEKEHSSPEARHFFAISKRETSINQQMWKYFSDQPPQLTLGVLELKKLKTPEPRALKNGNLFTVGYFVKPVRTSSLLKNAALGHPTTEWVDYFRSRGLHDTAQEIEKEMINPRPASQEPPMLYVYPDGRVTILEVPILPPENRPHQRARA